MEVLCPDVQYWYAGGETGRTALPMIKSLMDLRLTKDLRAFLSVEAGIGRRVRPGVGVQEPRNGVGREERVKTPQQAAEAILDSWRELGTGFENSRRSKETLDEDQRSFVQQNKDRAAEAWILERIESQHNDPEGVFSEQPGTEDRAEIQNLRQRNRRLSRKIERLEARINELENPGYRRLLKKLVNFKRTLTDRRLRD